MHFSLQSFFHHKDILGEGQELRGFDLKNNKAVGPLFFLVLAVFFLGGGLLLIEV